MDKQALTDTRNTSLKAVVFDLGNVILSFDNTLISGYIARKSGAHESDVRRFLFGAQLEKDIDTGAVTLAQFLDRINERFSSSIPLSEFEPVFCEVFTENTGVSSIIKDLKAGGTRLGLLSNTNKPHFEFIKTRFPVVGLMDDLHLSYETGFVKPGREAFDNLISYYRAKPGELVFIDDIGVNIKAAEALGIKALQYRGPEELAGSLKELGLKF